MRIALALCLLVAVGALVHAATSHLARLRTSLEATALRETRADLRNRASLLGKEIEANAAAAPVRAVYGADGSLRSPHPPAEARPFRPARGTLAAHYLAAGRPERALESATDSAERAQALLAIGVRDSDPKATAAALEEEALRGTDLALLARRSLGADAEFADQAAALLGGPSDRLGRALLSDAGLEPPIAPSERARLFRIRPRPGYFLEEGRLLFAARDGERILLREPPAPDLGSGTVEERLPPPLDFLVLKAEPDRAAVSASFRREARLLVTLYAVAGALLAAGAAFALAASARALRLAAAKSGFVANVTHELKTPIANIRLYCESLREGRVRSEDREEFLGTILAETRRLDALVEGLLHAARGVRIERSPLGAAEILREAEARFRPLLEREGFDLRVEPAPAVAFRGDREALLRALGNLLDNARKHARDDRRILLGAVAEEGRLRLFVRDRGPGIAPEDRARVLEPFTRLARAERDATPGAGLGLSLANACMEAHGGSLEIGGGAGEGAVVSLVLPLDAPDAGSAGNGRGR